MEHQQGLAEGQSPDLIKSPVRWGWMKGEGVPYAQGSTVHQEYHIHAVLGPPPHFSQ